MSSFKQLFNKKTFLKQNENVVIKPDKNYLKSLIQTSNNKFKQFKYIEINDDSCDIYYMPTKNQNYIGLQLGLSEQARLMKYNIQESTKIRSNSKNYIKIYKKDNKILKIEKFNNGKFDCTYLACYENEYRYLFPYTETGHKYPTYLCVSRFENNKVAEEYMVQSNQIIYSKYGKQKDGKVNYYYINYVPEGKAPILEEKSGYYLVDSLEYIEKEYYVWLQNR